MEESVQFRVGMTFLVDFVYGVNHSGVVFAAELLSDLRQRSRSQLLDQVHGDLAREGDGFGIRAHLEVLVSEAKLFADALLDQLNGDLLLLSGDDVAQGLLCRAEIYRRAGQRSVCDEPGQGAFQFPHVGFDRASDELGDVISKLEMFGLGFLLEDGDFGLQIGRLDIRDKSPFKARTQAFFDGGNLFGWAVGRQHNLFLQVVQRVKRMKEFLLGALFASDKFDIVNCRTSTETISKTDHAVKAEGIDYFVWTEHGRSPASGVFPIPTPP